MRGLLFKELRSMVPFIGLVVLLSLLSAVDELLTDQPDMRPLAVAASDYVTLPKEFSVLMFLLTFAVGSGLLVREHDEGTLEFLDSLPLSRTRVFFTKILLATAVLLIVPLCNVGIAVLLHMGSRTSLDPSFHAGILGTSIILHSCQLVVFLSLALALSFLRRFSWVVVGLLFWFYIAVHDWKPEIAQFDILSLTEARFEGQRWLLPEKQLKVQMALAGGLLLVAYVLFTGMGDQFLQAYDKVAQTRAGGAVLIVGSGLAVLLGFSLAVWFFTHSEEFAPPDDEPVVTYPSWSTGRAQTRWFSFVYPSNLTDRARAVISKADEVHETVRTFLAADAASRIAVDLSGTIPRHAGQAYWKTIRMDLTASEDVETLRAILGHETTHVFAETITKSRLGESFNSTRFFHEGLATYVEHRLFGTPQSIEPLRSVCAVMRFRDEVQFRELVDNEAFTRNRDTNLVYPLGECFVAALVEKYGDQAPAKVLHSFGRDDAPEKLKGMELWNDVFQAAGYNLDDTIDTFFARLDRLVDEHREFVTNLPRLRGAVQLQDFRVGVEVQWEPVPGWQPVCRFRQAADSPDRQYLHSFRDSDNIFWVPRDSFPASSFWYQLGLRESGGERVIYEPWLEIRFRR